MILWRVDQQKIVGGEEEKGTQSLFERCHPVDELEIL